MELSTNTWKEPIKFKILTCCKGATLECNKSQENANYYTNIFLTTEPSPS